MALISMGQLLFNSTLYYYIIFHTRALNSYPLDSMVLILQSLISSLMRWTNGANAKFGIRSIRFPERSWKIIVYFKILYLYLYLLFSLLSFSSSSLLILRSHDIFSISNWANFIPPQLRSYAATSNFLQDRVLTTVCGLKSRKFCKFLHLSS